MRLAAACSGVMAKGSPPEKRAAPVAGRLGSTRACSSSCTWLGARARARARVRLRVGVRA